MRFCRITPVLSSALFLSGVALLPPTPSHAQSQDARQSAHEQQAIDKAKQLEDSHQTSFAIDAYKKANKLAGGKCVVCLSHLCNLYRLVGDNKHAAESAAQLEQIVTQPADKASAALLQGAALLREAAHSKKRELFEQADAQFKLALQYQPTMMQPLFLDGLALGRLGNDAGAKDAFARYVAGNQADPIMQARARRYLTDIQLVRENMAPAFSIRTLQGTILSLDNLQGRVVLLDFWATWCGPCKQELPRIQQIAQRFQGEPLVVLSVSIDSDPAKWQTFVVDHGMTWPQFWDKGGIMATTFGVHAIPHYFTIDTNGVLSSQNLGSGSDLAGRLKKMVAQAKRTEEQPAVRSSAGQ